MENELDKTRAKLLEIQEELQQFKIKYGRLQRDAVDDSRIARYLRDYTIPAIERASGERASMIRKTTTEIIRKLRTELAEAHLALDCVLEEKPLPSGQYVHLVYCNGDRRQPAGTPGITCNCKVGRSALKQAHQEIENWKTGQKEFCATTTSMIEKISEKYDSLEQEYDRACRLLAQYEPIIQAVRELQAANRTFKESTGAGPEKAMPALEKYNSALYQLQTMQLPIDKPVENKPAPRSSKICMTPNGRLDGHMRYVRGDGNGGLVCAFCGKQ